MSTGGVAGTVADPKLVFTGLIPVVGQVLAGTCMVGALVAYEAGLAACAEQQETPEP